MKRISAPVLFALTLLFILCLSGPLLAAPGDLDPTFGTGGVVITDLYIPSLGNIDNARSIAIDASGRIIVVGVKNTGSSNIVTLVRYNSDGSLDTSFDVDGIVTTIMAGSVREVNDVEIDSNGKIVVVGNIVYGTSDTDFMLLRYNSNGSLDRSFGHNGKVTTVLSTDTDYAESLVIDSSGRILVAGSKTVARDSKDFAIVRYNIDGSLDNNFGGDGIVTTNLSFGPYNSRDLAYSISIDATGKIVVAGTIFNNSDTDCALVRYNSNGNLDTSFGERGIVVTDVSGTENENIRSVAIDSSGRILVAGHLYNGNDFDFLLVRYNSDGSLDTSFDGDGSVITDIERSNDFARRVTIDSRGRIVVAGTRDLDSGKDFVVARYNSDGSLDTRFGDNGIVITDLGSYLDDSSSLAIDTHDRIVVAGTTNLGRNNDFALVRYLSETLQATELTASLDNDQLTISWLPVLDATGFYLHYAPYPYQGPESIELVDLGNPKGTSTTFTLWPGAAYYIAVSAYNDEAESPLSNIELIIVQAADADQDNDGFDDPGEDCNDSDPNINPSATDLCGDGIDQDCNGVDAVCEELDAPVLTAFLDNEEVTVSWLPVLDATGYYLHYAPYPYQGQESIELVDLGNPKGTSTTFTLWPGAAYYIAVSAYNDELESPLSNIELIIVQAADTDQDNDGFDDPGEDCNDSDPNINPNAIDLCGDGIDQDCNGVDAVCEELDGDKDGYTVSEGDCDDSDSNVHPKAMDICGDGIDQDCNGVDAVCEELDGDKDGYTVSEGDCDDSDSNVHPKAMDICGDGIDQDCNGADAVCEELDGDKDGYTVSEGDCDDGDSNVHPKAEDICGDGIDQDCDGIDEQCPLSGPDLVISSGPPTATPSSVLPGATVQLSGLTVLNQGDTSTGAFFNGFYLSNDTIITSTDIYLSGVANNDLAPGESHALNDLDLRIPVDTLSGTYYIGILADYKDAVTESNESNNAQAQQITVLNGPDLVISTGAPTVTPSSVLPGETVTLSEWTVINQGDAASGPFQNGYYLSNDTIITSSDTYLSGAANDSLSPDEKLVWKGPVLTIPANTPTGIYYVGILVDREDAVLESDENNNAVLQKISVINGPDLVITTGKPSVTPSSVVSGETVQLSDWTVLNQGDVASGSFQNGYYLSNDTIITSSDTYLSGITNNDIAPGESFDRVGPDLTIPSGTAPGTYYVGILLDRNNDVAESNESNNYVAQQLTVLEPLTGNWAGTSSSSISKCSANLSAALVEDSATISGTGSMVGNCDSGSGSISSGTINGYNVSFSLLISKGNIISFTGKLSTDRQSMSGTYSWPFAGDSGTWSLNKF